MRMISPNFEEPERDQIRQALLDEIQRRGLSYRQIERALGWPSPGYISRMMQPRRHSSIRLVSALAVYLGMELRPTAGRQIQ